MYLVPLLTGQIHLAALLKGANVSGPPVKGDNRGFVIHSMYIPILGARCF